MLRFDPIVFVAFLFVQNPADSRVTFCAVGDVLLDRGIRRAINAHTIAYPFELVKPFIQKHNLALCNLECPVSAKGRSTGKIYCFRADTSFFLGVRDAGFNIYSLANNHIIDWGQEACLDTRSFIEAQNLYAIGVGKDQETAQKPLLLTENGLRFAFFAYLGEPLKGVVWPEKRPGPAQAGIDDICKAIREVRDRVDYVIVSMHWGIEYVHVPSRPQVSWAHDMIDAGADLVVGHHPHVLQSIEVYHDRMILYSLGNFVFDQRKSYQRQTGIFSCVFKAGHIDSARFTPCFISEYRPEIAIDSIYKTIKTEIMDISANFNVRFLDDSMAIYIADSNRTLARRTPLARLSCVNTRVIVHPDRVEMYDTLSSLADLMLMPSCDTINDCCLISNTTGYHLFLLITSTSQHARRHLIHTMPTDTGFTQIWCNQDIIDPWKIASADLNGDGVDELVAAVLARDSHQACAENQLCVYAIEQNQFNVLHQSSSKSINFIDFALWDRDQDGLEELFTLEPFATKEYTLNVYQWLGTGFWKYPVIIDTVATPWIDDVLHDTYGIIGYGD